jgi:hypothetical protein
VKTRTKAGEENRGTSYQESDELRAGIGKGWNGLFEPEMESVMGGE